MSMGRVCKDVWISQDAARTWTKLKDPEWSRMEGLFSFSLRPANPWQLFLFGGIWTRGRYADCWELSLEFEKGKPSATWTPWGPEADEDRMWRQTQSDTG